MTVGTKLNIHLNSIYDNNNEYWKVNPGLLFDLTANHIESIENHSRLFSSLQCTYIPQILSYVSTVICDFVVFNTNTI